MSSRGRYGCGLTYRREKEPERERAKEGAIGWPRAPRATRTALLRRSGTLVAEAANDAILRLESALAIVLRLVGSKLMRKGVGPGLVRRIGKVHGQMVDERDFAGGTLGIVVCRMNATVGALILQARAAFDIVKRDGFEPACTGSDVGVVVAVVAVIAVVIFVVLVFFVGRVAAFRSGLGSAAIAVVVLSAVTDVKLLGLVSAVSMAAAGIKEEDDTANSPLTSVSGWGAC